MRIKAFFLSILAIGLLVLVFARNSVFAAPSNNPVFATIEQVQQMINNALSPLTARLNNHEGRIATLESNLTVTPSPSPSITPSPTPIVSKSIKVFDASNQELGIFINGDPDERAMALFIEDLQKAVHIDTRNGNVGMWTNVYFTSSDCTGQAYSTSGSYWYNYIISVGGIKYYTFTSTFRSTQPISSYLEKVGNALQCLNSTSGDMVNMVSVQEV